MKIKTTLLWLFFVWFAFTIGLSLALLTNEVLSEDKAPIANVEISQAPTISPSPTPTLYIPPTSSTIPLKYHTFQEFNNCGPASLSMLMSYYDVNVSQSILGNKLRPNRNPQGINDDKNVFPYELAQESEVYEFISYHRPNGSLDLLKRFISSNYPVLVRTWLKPGEDIGHYRIVRGYDDSTQEILYDDSYLGKDKKTSYEQFEKDWQPFHYEYLVIAKKENQNSVESLIGEDIDIRTAWENIIARSEKTLEGDSSNVYPTFTLAVANFYLEDYEKSAILFEQIEKKLPPRMLWYQIEPIETYLQTKNYNRVFSLTSRILNGPNKAFSELYILRGYAYKEQGNLNAAKSEFQKAVLYNKNNSKAQEALKSV